MNTQTQPEQRDFERPGQNGGRQEATQSSRPQASGNESRPDDIGNRKSPTETAAPSSAANLKQVETGNSE